MGSFSGPILLIEGRKVGMHKFIKQFPQHFEIVVLNIYSHLRAVCNLEMIKRVTDSNMAKKPVQPSRQGMLILLFFFFVPLIDILLC